MKRYETTPIIFLAVSVICALCFAAVRCILSAFFLDARYGVYYHGSVLPNLFHIILAVACAAIAVAAFIKAMPRTGDYTFPHTDFTAFAAFASALLLMFDLLTSLYGVFFKNIEPSKFDIVEMCFCVPAIIYFFALTLKKQKYALPTAITSFFPTAWCAVCLIRIYFDNSILMTSPNKIIGQVALLAAMVYFLGESRIQLGIISHRLYLITASVAPILLLTSAIPNLLFSHKLAIGASDNTLRYAIEAAFALFMWARLLAYSRNPNLPECACSVGIIG